MAKSPNTNPFNNTWSTNYTYSQPYPSFFTQEMKDLINERKIEDEIDALDRTDEIVQNMLTYPDAEAILNKIKEASDD